MSDLPNIILFLTDDHGAWATGCYGNQEVKTPNLDALAARGTRFDHAYTPTPVCSPARASLMTGLTPSQVGIHDWLQEAYDDIAERDWLDGRATLFDHFKQAGYYTALSGKWHLGQSHLKPEAVDNHFGLPHWQGVHNEQYTYVRNGEEITLEGNKSGFITDHALEFIDAAPDDQPFFLYVGYIATHSPYHQQTHDTDLTKLYEKAEFSDIPTYEAHPWVKNESAPSDPTSQELRDRYIGYYAAVTEIDNNVGRIVEKLEQSGRLDNTVIVYTSDHGCAIGQHGFFGKGNSTRPLNMYETSLQVPLIWSGTGIEAGQVVGDYVDHHDTFMTLLELAWIFPEQRATYPGKSYIAQLRGQSQRWDNTCYGEYGDLRMVRDERWKLVYRYPDGPHDLFDLENDPGETNNLIDSDIAAEVIPRLKQKLDDFYDAYSDEEDSGLNVKKLPRHNDYEAWRDGLREGRGLQVY